MAERFENPLTYRSLYNSPLVSVREYWCRACRGGPEAEEYSGFNSVVLMRHGAFCKHFGRRTVTADVNQAVFFAKGSTYRVSHPADCGDRGTILEPSSRVLNDVIRELDPTIDERPDQPFRFDTGPCDSQMFWRHREFVQRLETVETHPLEPLWADVSALELTANLLQAAFARIDTPRKRRRKGTEADHIERAEAAKTYLASHLHEPITLEDVADHVHTSSFHLARLFQERAGLPIHRYLTRLRLRASIERLSEGARDLTAVALALGFSSHSHFTDAFRREFGRPPSEVRRGTARRTGEEVSKNPEV